jgi:acetoin utilization protein AcuB
MSTDLSIREYMTEHPYTIDCEETASAAEKVMLSHRIRHLPVVDGKRILGIVSDREISIARNAYRGRSFDGEILVKDVCQCNDCTVDESQHLSSVAKMMSKQRLEAVVVTKEGLPVGIFTTTDACRLLSELGTERKSFMGKLLGR